jgi:transcriptional regulator with XRE-family HTH domain
VKPPHPKQLGSQLRARREQLGLTQRQLAKLAGMTDATITRIEQGAIAAPAPDKLSRIAEALDLSLADVFAQADYILPRELPSYAPYLRSKYPQLPDEAIEQLGDSFEQIARRYGYDAAGPDPGEDEQPEQPT